MTIIFLLKELEKEEIPMINIILGKSYPIIAFAGILFAFLMTCICIAKLNKFLPKDIGRDFAHDGKLSAGKPRGAGIIFIIVFTLAIVIFGNINIEKIISNDIIINGDKYVFNRRTRKSWR